MKKSLLILSLLWVIALAWCNMIDTIRTKELVQTQEWRVELCYDRILKFIDSWASEFIGFENDWIKWDNFLYNINFLWSDWKYKEYSCLITNSWGYSIDLQEMIYNDQQTSFDNQDLIELAITHFPKSYTYYVWDVNHQSIEYETWEFVYPEDYHHYQNTLIPELNWMVDAEIVESNIHDARINGKPAIFTSRTVYLEDGSEIYVEYFNDPETLNFDSMMVFYWWDDNRFKVYKFYY